MTSRLGLVALAFAVAASAAVAVDRSSPPVSAAGAFEPLTAPARVLDTRPGESTADGRSQGIGIRQAGSTLRLRIGGRVGVPTDAEAVVLNLTVTQPAAPGFASVFPCGVSRPNASNLNYQSAGTTIANAAVVRVGTQGDVCLYTLARAHYVVDVSGYFEEGSFEPLPSPSRLLDSRPGERTVDGRFQGAGIRGAGTTLPLQVAGRAGIPADADAVMMNLTVTQPAAPGFAALYPCGVPRPLASSLNYATAGTTIANAAVAKIGTGGDVCLYTLARAHYVVDVSGYFPAGTYRPLGAPQRLLDTRPGERTVDGRFAGIGSRGPGSTLELQITGRAGIPSSATAAILNVTVTTPVAPGYATVYPRGVNRPNASNLNYTGGQTIANTVISKIGAGGDACLYTLTSAHYVVDVAGYIEGPAPAGDGAPCSPVGGDSYAASVSGRKILDQHGDVYLMRTFASWGMASNLSDAEITAALEGVRAAGFNAVTVFIGGGYNLNGSWSQYANHAGQRFWTGQPWRSSLGPAWSSVDRVVAETARLGMTANLSFGSAFGSTGARPDWERASNGDMHAAGVAIARRYLDADHIVWHIMFDDWVTADSNAGRKIDELFRGINDAEGAGRRPVRWVEPANGVSINTQFLSGARFSHVNITLNGVYGYGANSAELMEAGWSESGATSYPFGDTEPPYDGSPHYPGNLGQQLRERSYAVFLEGGTYINYGHEDWWPFGAIGLYSEGLSWQQVPTHSHTLQQSHVWSLIDDYVADRSWRPDGGSFLKVGNGSGDTKAAAGLSSTAAIAYFPSARSVTVDTTRLTGASRVRLRWYDPTNGRFTTISGSENTTSNRVVGPFPGNHGDGSRDWVLVVDAV